MQIVDALALIAVAGIWGGMAFFALVYAPLVFIKLDAATAGAFIRGVFPVYYLAMGTVSLAAAVLLAVGTTHGRLEVAVMAGVCTLFWVARQALVPRINRARDGRETDPGARTRFERLHRLSVAINALQLLAVLVLLARFVG